MAKTVFAMITLLEDGAFGGRPDQGLPNHNPPVDPGYDRPIHHPGHPDHGLPSRPNYPSQGLPGQGGRPDQGLPWTPGHPDNSLPMPPGMQPPPVPPGLANQLVVLWHLPGQPWHGKVMDPATANRPDQGLPSGGRPDQGLPETPEPKG